MAKPQSQMIRRSTVNRVLEMMEVVSDSHKQMGIDDNLYAKGYAQALDFFKRELGYRDEHPEETHG